MTTQKIRRFHVEWLLLVAFSILGQSVVKANAPRLMPGVAMPVLDVKTLNGDSVSLPRDTRARGVVLVIGFSKAATKTSNAWLDSCRSAGATGPAGSGVLCYDVRMLEGVPRALRGMVERGMRSKFPLELQRKTLLVYSENTAWRERVGATDDKAAYIIGCDGDGRVRSTATGDFTELKLKKILEAIVSVSPGR